MDFGKEVTHVSELLVNHVYRVLGLTRHGVKVAVELRGQISFYLPERPGIDLLRGNEYGLTQFNQHLNVSNMFVKHLPRPHYPLLFLNIPREKTQDVLKRLLEAPKDGCVEEAARGLE